MGASGGIGGGGEFSKGLGLALGAGGLETGLALLVFLAGGVGAVALSLKGFSPSSWLDEPGDCIFGLSTGLTGGAGVGAGGTGGGGGGS